MNSETRRSALETVAYAEQLEARTKLVVRSLWTIPALWSLLAAAATAWAVHRAGPGSWGLFAGGDGPVVEFYGQLRGYWGWALPIGIAGSALLYRRAQITAAFPHHSIWFAPLGVGVLIAVVLAALLLKEVLYPFSGPAGWFPWIALTTLSIGWLSGVRLLAVVSLPLVALSAYWYWWSSGALGLLCAIFALAYGVTALALKLQTANRVTPR